MEAYYIHHLKEDIIVLLHIVRYQQTGVENQLVFQNELNGPLYDKHTLFPEFHPASSVSNVFELFMRIRKKYPHLVGIC